MKRVLIATDLSDASKAAVDKGFALARSANAVVELVYVVDTNDFITPAALLDTTNHEKQATDALQAIAQSGTGLALHVHLLKDRQPAHAICMFAKSHNVDLIVVGSHGRTGMEAWLIGSVAERIARHASCDVLLVRNAA
ncbi:MAG: universal stress protein [Polyangiales bacterium]